jgi:RHS repeat-associated protein
MFYPTHRQHHHPLDYTTNQLLRPTLTIKNLTTTYNTPLVGGTPSLVNRYQYNGKEFETDLGLMWNDYGARWYDPQRSVWGQIDPLAEKYYGWSGYNYVAGNPIG